jgi:hypothetical protein
MGVKYSVNEKFFDTWDTEMAYVLGYMFADGSLEDSPEIRGKYVRVSSTDLDRIEYIREVFKSKHTIIADKPSPRHKMRYLLRIGSRGLYVGVMNRGVTPRKSLTMTFPDVPLPFLPAFVRGYFDGDGCARIDVVHGKPKRILAIFTSGSKKFLSSLHNHLVAEIGIKGPGLYKHGGTKGAYQLRYSARDSLRLFSYMYPAPFDTRLCLKRKYAIFEEYLALRGISRADIPKVLKQKGPVVKG